MGTRHINISFEQAKPFLEDGDLCLFRGSGIISWFIQAFGGSPFSHVGVITKHGTNGGTIVELAEFREFIGSRVSLLERQVEKYSGQIDIFRPNPYFYNYYYSNIKHEVVEYKAKFHGKKITNCMRLLTGEDYNYNTIWQIAKSKLFGFRLFQNYNQIGDDSIDTKPNKYVCSTAIAHCFTEHGYDLVKQKADVYIEPGDLARSTSLNYLFTLTK